MKHFSKFTFLTTLILVNLFPRDSYGQLQLNCGESNWFRGFTSDAGITFTTAAVKQSCTIVSTGSTLSFWAIGGSTTNAAILNPAMSAQPGAVILTYDYDVNKEFSTHVQTEVTYTNSLSVTQTVSVVGVKAISVKHQGCGEPHVCQDTSNGATDSDGDDCVIYNSNVWGCGGFDDADFSSNSMCCCCGGGFVPSGKFVLGVFEPSDGQTMIFFRLDEQKLTTFVIPDHEYGYGCSMTNEHLRYWDETYQYFIYEKCDNSATYLTNYNSATSTMWTGEMIIKQDTANSVTPVGVTSELDTGRTTAVAYETGLSTPGLLHIITFPALSNPSSWLDQHECMLTFDMSLTGIVLYFEFKSVIMKASIYAIVAAEHLNCGTNCGLTFFGFSVDEVMCGTLAKTQTLMSTSGSGQYTLLAHQAVDDIYEIIAFYDSVTDNYGLIRDFDSMRFDTYTALRIKFTSLSSNPAFSWDNQITSMLFDTTSMPMAIGGSFILRQQAAAMLEFLEIDNSANIYADYQLDITPNTEIIGDSWGTNEAQSSMTMQHETIFKLTGFKFTAYQNPAKIILSHVIPDQTIYFNECVPGYTAYLNVLLPSPTADPLTLSGVSCTSTRIDYSLGLVTTSPGGSIISVPGFIMPSLSIPDSIDITVTDLALTPQGPYYVYSKAGYADETAVELNEHADQSFNLIIESLKGYLTAPAVPESPITYEIRDIPMTQFFTIAAYNVVGAFECLNAEVLTVSPTHLWLTLVGRDITVENVTDKLFDGLSFVFTVTATDAYFYDNVDLTFQVDFIAPCLTSTINALTFDIGPNIVAADRAGSVSQIFHHSGDSYGGLLGYCGSLSFALLDSSQLPFSGSWVALAIDITPETDSITATPYSVMNELQGTHTFYIQVSINSVNYSDSDIAPILQAITVTVSPCEVTSYTYPTATSMQILTTIGYSATTSRIEQWVQVPCGYLDTLTVVPDLTGYSWIDLVGRDLIVNPSVGDSSLVGGISSQIFTVTSTLIEDPIIGTGVVELTVTIIDRCVGVTINQLIEWVDSSDIFMIDRTTDTLRFTWSGVSDPTCTSAMHGPLSFEFQNSADSSIFSGGWISTVYSDSGGGYAFDLNPIGVTSQVYDLQVEVSIAAYSDIIQPVTIQFTVSICGDVTALTPPTIDWTVFNNYVLGVTEQVVVIIDPYTQTGGYEDLCTETLSITPDTEQFPWITLEGRTITLDSSDLDLQDLSTTFTLTSQVNDFDYTSDSSQVFTVTFGEMPEYVISLNETEEAEADEATESIVIAAVTDDTANSTQSMAREADLIEQQFKDWFANQQSSYSPHALPLIASLKDFSQVSELTIRFNKEMLIPPEFEANQNSDSVIFQINRLIDLSVVSQRDFADDQLDLLKIESYELVSYKNRTLTIKVFFANPDYISMNAAEKDRLRVHFKETWFFIDSVQRQRLPEDTILSIEMERQRTLEQDLALQQLDQQIESVFNYGAGITLAVNFLLAYALKYLWNMVNIFQFLVFMCQWQLSYPDNALLYLSKMKILVLFEFIPTNDIQTWISERLGLEISDCSTDECEEPSRRMLQDEEKSAETTVKKSNFGSDNLIKNMGIMLIIALAIAIFLLVFRLTKWIAYSDYKYYRRYMMLHDKIFYNLFIRYIIQSALKIQIAAYTTIALVTWASTSGFIQGLVSVCVLIAVTLGPLIFAWVIFKNRDNLSRLSIQAKIGSMYTGVWLSDELSYFPLSYSIVFLLRRTTFAVITFMLFNYPGIQILAFITISMMYVSYLNLSRIYTERFSLYLENLNESIFLIVCYHILLFTNVLDDPQLLSDVGKSMLVGVGLILMAGMVVILFVNIKGFVWYIKKRKAQRKHKASLADQTQVKAATKAHTTTQAQARNQRKEIVAEDIDQGGDLFVLQSLSSSDQSSQVSSSLSSQPSPYVSNEWMSTPKSEQEISRPDIIETRENIDIELLHRFQRNANTMQRCNEHFGSLLKPKELSQLYSSYGLNGQTWAQLQQQQEMLTIGRHTPINFSRYETPGNSMQHTEQKRYQSEVRREEQQLFFGAETVLQRQSKNVEMQIKARNIKPSLVKYQSDNSHNQLFSNF